MISLRDLQTRFMSAVLDADFEGAAASLSTLQVDASHRFGLYAANARSTFLASLRSTFPVIERLVGADYFRQCVRLYQQSHPSRSGDLTPAGGDFPAFLTKVHGDGEFDYLGDMARLEWLIQESSLAAGFARLDFETLAAVPPQQYDRLHFRVHPSLRLFASRRPCVRIWKANQDRLRQPELIDLASVGCRVAIARLDGEVQFLPLEDGEFHCLGALSNALPFAVALEQAGAVADFDAVAALRRFVQWGLIVDCGVLHC